MALRSKMVGLGTAMPDVTLPDLDGNPVRLRSLAGGSLAGGRPAGGRPAGGRPLVVAFLCNHCPYVRHIEWELARVAGRLMESGIGFVGICSNNVESHPDDDVTGLRDQARRAGWTFPYLVDTDQSAALDFGAACTPDFFGYSADGSLAYRGAFDNSTPGNDQPVDGFLLQRAMSAVLVGAEIPEPQRPSIGCGIKWKPENEPKVVSSE